MLNGEVASRYNFRSHREKPRWTYEGGERGIEDILTDLCEGIGAANTSDLIVNGLKCFVLWNQRFRCHRKILI